MKNIIIVMLLLLLGCVQPSQFTKDCSIYEDIALITNCYKEQAYYSAAIGDTSKAISLCNQMYSSIEKARKPGFMEVFFSFDKTMATIARTLFLIDNYNNCILNVARLSRDEDICSNSKVPKDILGPLGVALDSFIPSPLGSEEMCRTEVRIIIARDKTIKPFKEYIK